MTLALSHLPASAREIASVIGLPAALRLIEAFGGQTLAIAKGKRLRGVARHQELAEKVGAVAAKSLCQRYGGTYLSVPKCLAATRAARDAQLQARFDALTAGGHTARAAVVLLVREFDLVDSSVWRVLKRPSGALAVTERTLDATQPGLF